jgi:hypothetical protein
MWDRYNLPGSFPVAGFSINEAENLDSATTVLV